MNMLLKTIEQAIIKIDHDNYCKIKYKTGNNYVIQKAERVFAYELYYQIRCMIEADRGKFLNMFRAGRNGMKDLLLHGELTKPLGSVCIDDFGFEENNGLKLKKDDEELSEEERQSDIGKYSASRLVPDIVLHKAQDSKSDNALAIEIKVAYVKNGDTGRISQQELLKDLIKLGNYVDGFKYEKGIFISVGTSFNEVKGQIIELFKGKPQNTYPKEKVSFINYNNGSIKVVSLSDLNK